MKINSVAKYGGSVALIAAAAIGLSPSIASADVYNTVNGCGYNGLGEFNIIVSSYIDSGIIKIGYAVGCGISNTYPENAPVLLADGGVASFEDVPTQGATAAITVSPSSLVGVTSANPTTASNGYAQLSIPTTASGTITLNIVTNVPYGTSASPNLIDDGGLIALSPTFQVMAPWPPPTTTPPVATTPPVVHASPAPVPHTDQPVS